MIAKRNNDNPKKAGEPFPGLEHLALTVKQIERMKAMAPLLHTGDAEILFQVSEDMHSRRPEFPDVVLRSKFIAKYADALHFGKQDDHFHAAEFYADAAEMIIDSAKPTKKNVDLAIHLIGSAIIHMDKHFTGGESSLENSEQSLLLGLRINELQDRIVKLARRDLPGIRD